uniref:Putative nuclear matrix constituent protein 1-like protein n=1 Tax=Rhizophora mucronata TaxID=61149 RepID=A0A2P2MH28_RHIMU
MFTPQRKVWPGGLSLTPRSDAQKKSLGTGSDPNLNSNGPSSHMKFRDGSVFKGKSVALVAEPATPNGVGLALDGEGLAEKVSRLENELFEYQYNMGLLLIEKREWASKYQGLEQAIGETKDALKQERAAHLIAISDAEKREENLRKALGVEKECVLDLEKVVREMRSENAEIKFTADSKFAEANALSASIEEKSLEIEAKLHAADAKLAEINRKSSEIERKSQEVESREAALRREHLSFVSGREAHEGDLSKQREELREWERKLQEGEERLSKAQRIINQREERANENDRIFKQKENDLEEARKKIEEGNKILKKKEEDISSRLASLTLKEKEFDTTRKKLEKKEGELRAWEEQLNDRERVEIQKLIDEHNAIIDGKKREFELEVEQRRKSVDEDLQSKLILVEKKEAEIKHMEEKVVKREQALDKKLEKLKEKEKEFESKMNALKEREKTFRSEVESFETEKKQLQLDREDILNLKAEIERIRAANEEQLLQIREEKDRLKVSEEERSEHTRLQSELKQEIEKCRLQEELLLKEMEDLKRQKENFERQWEELDEKRSEIEKVARSISEQKEKFEKQKLSEEERMKREKQATEDYVKRELEALEVAKESFEANMEHERNVTVEKAQTERNQMLLDLEQQKSVFENDMQKRQEEMEKLLQDKKKSFDDERERELKNLNFLRDVAKREMDDLKAERLRMEKERQEIGENKIHIQKQQIEIREDIDKLGELSRKLKEHRQQLVKEKERFILFVEQHKSCKGCSELTSEFVLSDIISSHEIENVVAIPVSRLVPVAGGVNGDIDGSKSQECNVSPTTVHSLSPVSWLRKYTSKILMFSPSKKDEPAAVQDLNEGSSVSALQVNLEEPSKGLDFKENGPELSFAIVDNSVGVQRVQSGSSTRDAEPAQDLSTDDQSNICKVPEHEEDSQTSDVKHGRQRRKRGRPRVSRTRSVKAVVQEANAILGESLEINDNEDSSLLKAESRDESHLAGKETPRKSRKRNRTHTSQATWSEHDVGDSEEHSDNVAAGEHKKIRQEAPVQAHGGARYNLRQQKLGGKVITAKASEDLNNDKEKENEVAGGPEHRSLLRAAPASSIVVASDNGGSTHFGRCKKVSETWNGDADTTRKLVENAALSEEVNGSTGYGIAEENTSESQRHNDNEDEGTDDEDESKHPGEVSMGKKLWTFFTT